MVVGTEVREVGYFDLSETAELVSGRPISEATVEIAVTDVPYTGYGSELSSVVVTCDGETLVAGQDYVCTYSNNVNLGTATLFVNGVGDFAGTVSHTFNVVPATPTLLATMSADVSRIDTRTNEILSVGTWLELPEFVWNTSESFKANPFPEWTVGGLPASSRAVATLSVSPVVGWTVDPQTEERTPVTDESLRQVLSDASGEGANVFKSLKGGLYEARLTIATDGVTGSRALKRVFKVRSGIGLMIFLR